MSRLTFRPWNPELDAEAAFRIYSDPEVIRYLGRSPTVTASAEEQRERLQKIVDSMALRGDNTGVWAPCFEVEPIGSALYKELPDGEGGLTGDYEIGWHLRQDMWGKGFGTEIGQAMLDRALLDVDRVLAIAYPENLASLRIMEKIGMKPIGLTDRYYGVECMAYECCSLTGDGDDTASDR